LTAGPPGTTFSPAPHHRGRPQRE